MNDNETFVSTIPAKQLAYAKKAIDDAAEKLDDLTDPEDQEFFSSPMLMARIINETSIDTDRRSMDVVSKKNPSVGTKVHAFRAHLAAYHLLDDLKNTHAGRKVRMLDIGGSHGVHARFFRSHGIQVDLIDMVAGDEPPIWVGDYLEFKPEAPYDVIWSSHVVEHVRNVGSFVDKMLVDVAKDGYVVASVPPMRGEKMAYNHMSFWNPGMLLLTFGMSGFDMRTARVGKYGYNVSIIAKRASHVTPDIKDSVPEEMRLSDKHFNGDFKYHNWLPKFQKYLPALPMTKKIYATVEEGENALKKDGKKLFCYVDIEGTKRLHYLDAGTLLRAY